ncbi:all-trans-retinol 13,14-reductase-like [Saccoglossus kowalevskii]
MELTRSVYAWMVSNPSLVVAVLLAVLFITVLAKFMSGPPVGKNPFAKATTSPPQPLVTDQAKRNNVLKQGIHYIGGMRNLTNFKVYIDHITDGQLQWTGVVEPYDTVVIGDNEKARHYPMYGGKDEFKQSLLDKFPQEKKAIDKYFDLLKATRASALGHVMAKIVPTWWIDFLASTGLIHYFTNYYKYSQRSVSDVMNELTDNKELQTVIAYSFGDYGSPPSEGSFAMHCDLINHMRYGVSYPVGGASEIAFHIIPSIEKAGGKVLVRAQVSQILLEDSGKAFGVRVHKSSGDVDIHAPIIISDAGFFNTFQSLLPPQIMDKSGFKPMVKKGTIKHGVGAMSIFVGLKGSKEDLALEGRNWWVYTSNDITNITEEYIGRSVENVLKDDIPLLFISFPSAKDPTWEQRYPGKSTCAVVTLANWEWFKKWENERVMKRGEEYDKLKNSIGERAWAQVLRLFPHLKDKVDYFEVGSPVSNKYYLGSPAGEIYGLDHTKERFGPKAVTRLRAQTMVPNLYMTGQDILSCGFAGAAYGGLLSASAVLNRNLFKDLSQLKKTIAKNK